MFLASTLIIVMGNSCVGEICVVVRFVAVLAEQILHRWPETQKQRIMYACELNCSVCLCGGACFLFLFLFSEGRHTGSTRCRKQTNGLALVLSLSLFLTHTKSEQISNGSSSLSFPVRPKSGSFSRLTDLSPRRAGPPSVESFIWDLATSTHLPAHPPTTLFTTLNQSSAPLLRVLLRSIN